VVTPYAYFWIIPSIGLGREAGFYPLACKDQQQL